MYNKSVNKVTLVGNLSADPEIKYTQNGGTVVNLTVVTNQSIKNSSTGVYENEAEFHNCVAFGKFAELIAKDHKKNDLVFVSGSNKTTSYYDKEFTSVKKYSTKVMINEFELLTAYSNRSNQQQNDQQQPNEPQYSQQNAPVYQEVKKPIPTHKEQK